MLQNITVFTLNLNMDDRKLICQHAEFLIQFFFVENLSKLAPYHCCCDMRVIVVTLEVFSWW